MPLIYGLAIVVVVLAAYVECLGGTFLWDDRLLVLASPLVQSVASVGDYVRNPFWSGAAGQPHSTSYYRPLVTASFALDQQLHGGNAAGFHLTNIVFHTLNALLLYALVRRTGVRSSVAALVAAAWALLPRLAEVAAWISGRTDSVAATAVLLALLVWGPSWPRRIAAALVLGVGLFAKESALAGVAAIAVLELRDTPGTPWRTRSRALVLRLVAPILAVGVYVALRVSAVGFHREGTVLGWRRALAFLEATGSYTLMLLDPLRPRAVIGRVGVVTPLGVTVGIASLAVVVVFVWRRGRTLQTWTACGLTLAAAALFPVMQAIPLPIRTLVADRFLYLPCAGLALAAARTLDRWLAVRRAAWAGALAAVVVLFGATYRRATVWSDELTFWVSTYLETPHINSAAATELMGVYYRAGLFQDALVLAERVRGYDDPGGKAKGEYNGAVCLSRLGRRKEALERLTTHFTGERARGDQEVQTAILELQLGNEAAAQARLTKLVEKSHPGARALLQHLPEYVEARRALGGLGERDFEERARLEALLGDDASAGADWIQAARQPTSSEQAVLAALRYLVQTGDRAGISEVARIHVARFGALDPELEAIVSLKLGELERLGAARATLGLPNPATSAASVSAAR